MSEFESGTTENPRDSTIEALAGALEVPPRALTDDQAFAREFLRVVGVELPELAPDVDSTSYVEPPLDETDGAIDSLQRQIQRIAGELDTLKRRRAAPPRPPAPPGQEPDARRK